MSDRALAVILFAVAAASPVSPSARPPWLVVIVADRHRLEDSGSGSAATTR